MRGLLSSCPKQLGTHESFGGVDCSRGKAAILFATNVTAVILDDGLTRSSISERKSR